MNALSPAPLFLEEVSAVVASVAQSRRPSISEEESGVQKNDFDRVMGRKNGAL